MADIDCKSDSNEDCGGSWYENEAHHSGLLEMMKLMYDSHQLTDVCVTVNSRNFLCHRAVLAATSRYFHAMFTSNLAESRQSDIHLHEVDSESVGALINYAYTGRICITRLNVQNLMFTTSLFQVSAVFEACARFMETQLDDSNCVGILCFAHAHNCMHLYGKSLEHIEKNFIQVSQGEEFLALDSERLFEILSSNELNVDHEELVFDALMRWVQFKEEKRAEHLSKLLSAIRFGLLSSRFIREHVLDNRLISEHGKQILRDTEAHVLASVENYRSTTISVVRPSVVSTLRSGMIKPEHCIVLVGGVDDCHPSINCYNPLTRETYYIADVSNDNRTGYYSIVKPACVVTDDNQLYLAGGSYVFHEQQVDGTEAACDEDSFDEFDDDVVGKNFYLYDGDHNRWITRASMLFPKSNFALASVCGKIYCFGGLSINQHPSEIVECYDTASNQWKYTGMMPTTLVDLVAVTHNQNIYIFGGRTGVTVHDSAMRYDPRRSEWSTLATMRTPRFNCGACCVAGEVYVIGGQIYSHVGHTINRLSLRNVDIYNIERDRWRPGPPLPDPLYNVGAMVLDGVLYACGSLEHHRIAYRLYRCNVVYRLDLTRSVWTRLESDLCTVRDYACVAVRMHTRRLSQVFRPEVDT